MQATSTSPRFLPFRIKATGKAGVFDSQRGEWTPCSLGYDFARQLATRWLTSGDGPVLRMWFPACREYI